MMKKHVREIVAIAVAAAHTHGVNVHLEPGGRHLHLVFEGRGTRRVKPVSCSPRDEGDSVNLARQDIRRLLREMMS